MVMVDDKNDRNEKQMRVSAVSSVRKKKKNRMPFIGHFPNDRTNLVVPIGPTTISKKGFSSQNHGKKPIVTPPVVRTSQIPGNSFDCVFVTLN